MRGKKKDMKNDLNWGKDTDAALATSGPRCDLYPTPGTRPPSESSATEMPESQSHLCRELRMCCLCLLLLFLHVAPHRPLTNHPFDTGFSLSQPPMGDSRQQCDPTHLVV